VPVISVDSRPRLRRGVRLVFDAARGARVLLYPEGVLVPNQTAADVLERCDGSSSVAAIAASLAGAYDGVRIDDVLALLDRLAERRFIEVTPPAPEDAPQPENAPQSKSAPQPENPPQAGEADA
jgi:pyrroloquinoline quinone biosynthesis protein D